MRLSRKVYKSGIVVLYGLLIYLPIVLHKQSYLILNNDTAAHLKAFETGNTIYGAQVITGYTMKILSAITGISTIECFMAFNFIMLMSAGFVIGWMVYRLTKSDIAGLLAIGLSTLGLNATMHLFYSGTIFNIIGVLILMPLLIVLFHWLIKQKLYWLTGVIAIPLLAGAWYYHPSLGMGILATGEWKETVIAPIEAITVLYGMYNIILLFAVSVLMVKNKIKVNNFNKVIIVLLIVGIISSGVIGFWGLNAYPSRVIINMCLLLMVVTLIIMGMVMQQSKKGAKILVSGLAVISLIPGTISWVGNSIIKGATANAILSA